MKITGRDCFSKDNFDERQLLIRGNAYRYAYYTALMLLAVWMIISEVFTSMPVTSGLAVFIIMMISIDVYAIYSILNDAYFGINFDRRRYFIFFLVVVAMNLIGGVVNIIGNEVTAQFGLLECANLTVAVGFVPILVLMGLKSGKDKEDDEDEES